MQQNGNMWVLQIYIFHREDKLYNKLKQNNDITRICILKLHTVSKC